MNLLFFLQRFKENKWLRGGLDPLLYPAKGFTLIEVIVSLVIMGISIVTILQLFSGGLRSIKVSDDYLRAAILAQNKMNELESKFNIFKDNQKGVFEQDDNYHWALSVENYDLAGLHPQFENLKDENTEKSIFVDKVKLKVFWNSEHGQREMELVTLKSSTTANQSSKDLLLGKYSRAFNISRGLQFGEQNLPSGQSARKYVRINMSGVTYTVKEIISGAGMVSEISGN